MTHLYKRTNNVIVGMVLVSFHLLYKPVYVSSYLPVSSCLNCFCNQFECVAVLLNSFYASCVLFSCPIYASRICCPDDTFECFAICCLRIYLRLSSFFQSAYQSNTRSVWFHWWCPLSCFHFLLLHLWKKVKMIFVWSYVLTQYVKFLSDLLDAFCLFFEWVTWHR